MQIQGNHEWYSPETVERRAVGTTVEQLMNEVAGADADKVERAQGRLYGVWVIEHNICNAIEHYPSGRLYVPVSRCN